MILSSRLLQSQGYCQECQAPNGISQLQHRCCNFPDMYQTLCNHRSWVLAQKAQDRFDTLTAIKGQTGRD